jgi:hypothetical protein
MKRVSFILTGLILLTTLPALSGHGAEPKDQVADLMKRKLAESQKLLAGIALGDFDEITRHSEELIVISNQAEWKVLRTPRYEIYSNEFRRTAETIVKNARQKNLDGAALGYVDMTLNCVKCHKYVREERMTRRDGGRRPLDGE